MGRVMVPQPVRPLAPKVVPVRPVKPMVVPRGPVRPGVPMGYGVPFRTRPGMPGPKVMVVSKPMVMPVRPGMPKPVPVARPVVAPKPVPVKPVGVPMRPMVPPKKPLVGQMVQAPGYVFRARPGEVDEEGDYQEEEYGEEGYYEYDEEGQEEGAETQFRTRPGFVPVGPRPPMVVKPKVVPAPVLAPKPVVMAPKRGPVPRGPVPVPGYNTFQPRFRGRPRPLVKPMPMAPPMATFKPVPYGVPPKVVRNPLVVPGPKKAYGFGPVFRSRPRSASYDANQEFVDENEYQYTEGCESSVCTKCGKEF